MRCLECNIVVDLDINASENIFYKGVRFAMDGFIDEMEHLNGEFRRCEAVNICAGYLPITLQNRI